MALDIDKPFAQGDALNRTHHHRSNVTKELMRRMEQQKALPEIGSKRIYERKKYEPEVVFAHSNRLYKGCMKNISLGGAYIEAYCVNQFSKHDIIIINIPFPHNKKVVKRKGRVKWQNNVGFAIEFI